MATRTLLARGEAVYADVKRRTASDLVVNSSGVWADLDTGLDITLTAATGDRIEAAISSIWLNEPTNGRLDVATIVSAAPVTYFSSGTGTPTTSGLLGWLGLSVQLTSVGPPVMLTLVSGDISSGTVTLRLRTQTSSAANKTLLAGGGEALIFTAKNLGPG